LVLISAGIVQSNPHDYGAPLKPAS